MVLYQHLEKECSIILCAQRAPDETPQKVLSHELRGDGFAAVRETLLSPCELKPISSKLFGDEVILQLLKPKNLGADFDDETAVQANVIFDDLWEQVRSNWARIDYLAQLFAVGLKQLSQKDDRGVWVITQEVVDWVLQMLRGHVSAAQGDERNYDDEVDEAVVEAA